MARKIARLLSFALAAASAWSKTQELVRHAVEGSDKVYGDDVGLAVPADHVVDQLGQDEDVVHATAEPPKAHLALRQPLLALPRQPPQQHHREQLVRVRQKTDAAVLAIGLGNVAKRGSVDQLLHGAVD
jgi:hypothetical protein